MSRSYPPWRLHGMNGTALPFFFFFFAFTVGMQIYERDFKQHTCIVHLRKAHLSELQFVSDTELQVP
jgi:hypothetical protein